MLRSLVVRSGGVACGLRRSLAAGVRHNPSTSTSVVLTRLPANLTESKLKQELSAVDCRKIELQPGCSLFFNDEAEARIAANYITGKRSLEALVTPASMPCLALQNVPETVTVDTLEKGFSGQNPQTVRFSGSNTLQIKVSSDADAGKVLRSVEGVEVEGQKLKARATRISKNHYVVSVFNIPATGAAAARSAVNDALAQAKLAAAARVEDGNVSQPTILLRYSDLDYHEIDTHVEELEAALAKSGLAEKVEVAEINDLLKPAVFLRNIGHLQDQSLGPLLGPHRQHVARVQLLRPSPDKLPNLAVVYFHDEAAAFACVSDLHSKVVEDKRISATYREVTEPAVQLEGVPAEVTTEELHTLARAAGLEVHRVERSADSDVVTVVVTGPKEARLAEEFFQNREIGGAVVTAEAFEVHDTSIVLAPAAGSDVTPAAIADALKDVSRKHKSMTYKTNVRAEVGFLSVDEAHTALNRYVSGGVKLPACATSGQSAASTVAASLSALPAYVLQISGLSPETPVQELTDALASEAPEARVIRADRSALLKFRRNQHVMPGIKKLKALQLEGQKVRVDRYRPLQQEGDSAYDKVTGEDSKALLETERFTVHSIVRNFMHLDPATRYQIAKNAFNRELYDARVDDSIEDLFDDTRLTPEVMAEAQELFKKSGRAKHMDDAEINHRLFQIFCQTEEMMKYSADFRELTTLLGAPDEDDAYDWSQFDPSDDNIQRLIREMREADEEALEELVSGARKGKAKGRPAASNASLEEFAAAANLTSSDSDSDELSLDELDAFSSSDEDESESEDEDEDQKDANQPKPAAKSPAPVQAQAQPAEDGAEAAEAQHESDFDSSSDFDSDAEFDFNPLNRDAEDGDLPGLDGDETVDRRENKQDWQDTPKEIRKRKQFDAMFRDEEGNFLNITSLPNGDFIDPSGNIWAMTVFNSDTTQKTMPGGRMVSHRTLVVLGNMKGTAGFGMGKGKTPEASLNAACRAAMRNLLHIDLYDNFGLAHDLYGKHNSCHCYIRATPAAREMVASNFAEQVLNLFGISSASVKIIGNRNPYSQMNALFNALSHHENLDEVAKDRGKRYLTLRWAHSKGV